jgi:SNF2 family DNA or RNA helicase
MPTRDDLHEYQHGAIDFIMDRKGCALFLDMGLGKTVSTLTAICDLLDNYSVNRVLVIAPLRVANTVWQQEAAKWSHTSDLVVSVCTGTASERRRAVASDAEVMVINRENVQWLVENHKWKWDMVVIDESSSFKSPSAKRFKALRKVLKHVTRMVLLTGTPAPNGQMDLWSQMFLIDQGERLGKTVTGFRQRFFNQVGYGGYTYEIAPGSADKINGLIQDVCLSMSADDYLDLPERIDMIERVTLSQSAWNIYRELEKEFLVELDAGTITAMSAGVLANKLLQLANGAMYDENQEAHYIHKDKLDALQQIVEDNPTENLLVAYNYKTDLARLQATFPDAVTLSKSGEELEAWNRGEISMLLAHPASAGHGLNAQHGGYVIVWFGLNWSLELYQQFNARLHRQGQTQPVRVMHLVAAGTIDERVLGAIADKAETQADILNYIKKDVYNI